MTMLDPVPMASAVRSPSVADARTHLKDLLDAANEGRTATVNRGGQLSAVVDAERLREALALLVPAGAQIVPEADEFSAFIPGIAIATGATLDEAVDDLILALREYAEDWGTRLRQAPNHAGNWGLVQLVGLSNDEQLHDWLVG